MYTIRDLCKASNLSRSAILYYDSLGLLKPAERSASNYRLYSDESLKTLKEICLYRNAGVGLSDIGELINVSEGNEKGVMILEEALYQLNRHIQELYEKQRMIVNMVKQRKSKSDDVNRESNYEELLKLIPSFTLNPFKAMLWGDDETQSISLTEREEQK